MRFATALALVAFLATAAHAQAPAIQQISFQGVLTDGGAAVPDGPKSILFALKSGASTVWSEAASVTTTDGLFAHRLGSVSAFSSVNFAVPLTITATYTPAVGSPVAFGPTPLGAVPVAHTALNSGTVTFPLSGSAASTVSVFQVTNTGTGDALRVNNAGDDGLQISNAGGDGVYVSSAGEDGVDVFNAGGAGLFAENVQYGVRVINPSLDGLHVQAAGDDGLQVSAATGRGIEIGTTGSDGIFVDNAGSIGMWVSRAGHRGFEVDYAADMGLFVFRTGDTNFDGTPDVDRDGVNVGWAGGDGVQVSRANGYGVTATGDEGNYVRSSSTALFATDLVLGASSSSATGDDGVISSDPTYSGSDLFIRSNDAVSVYLDMDNNESGDFEVWSGTNVRVWSVNESGTVTNLNGAISAENSIQIDDPTAPSARTLTLPSTVSHDRLVAFSGNATTDGAGRAVVELPAYAESVAGDFRYQLTAIGSFAQAIVGEEVSGGRFAILTSEPGVKVSWRVEGVRTDAWAMANAHEAVSAKDQLGTYIHPEIFGASAAQSARAAVEDGPSQLTPEGQRRLEAEAADIAEIEAGVALARAEREQERASEATARANEAPRQRETVEE